MSLIRQIDTQARLAHHPGVPFQEFELAGETLSCRGLSLESLRT